MSGGPDPTFRKAKATAGALGIPSREYVTRIALHGPVNARASPGWNVQANWLISTRRRGGYRKSSTRNSNKPNLRTGLDCRKRLRSHSKRVSLRSPSSLPESSLSVQRSLATARRTKGRCSECRTDALSLILNEAARHYAAIRLELKGAGTPIPEPRLPLRFCERIETANLADVKRKNKTPSHVAVGGSAFTNKRESKLNGANET
jgi:hypothetical protein